MRGVMKSSSQKQAVDSHRSRGGLDGGEVPGPCVAERGEEVVSPIDVTGGVRVKSVSGDCAPGAVRCLPIGCFTPGVIDMGLGANRLLGAR
jgi:hypothetical protein